MKVCRLEDILPTAGVCALVAGEQVAIFRVGDEVFAIDQQLLVFRRIGDHVAIGNRDPFSGANVLSRGIVGDLNGELVVASPVYKQHFSLRTGRCIEDASVSVPVYRVGVEGADIQILKTGESPCRT